MIKNNMTDMKIKEITSALSTVFKDEKLKLLILFGSVVTGKIHKRSDIDLAFLYDNKIDIVDLTNKISVLLHTDNVDIVDLRKANPVLSFAVVKSGKLLYEREQGIFSEFCSLAFRRYVDTKKLREAQKMSIESFLNKRGIT